MTAGLIRTSFQAADTTKTKYAIINRKLTLGVYFLLWLRLH